MIQSSTSHHRSNDISEMIYRLKTRLALANFKRQHGYERCDLNTLELNLLLRPTMKSLMNKRARAVSAFPQPQHRYYPTPPLRNKIHKSKSSCSPTQIQVPYSAQRSTSPRPAYSPLSYDSMSSDDEDAANLLVMLHHTTMTSLPNIKHWPTGMWVVFLTAVGVILAFAAFHIYLAVEQPLPFVIYYVCGLLVPSFFLAASFAIQKEVNTNWTRTFLFRFRQQPKPSSIHYGATKPDDLEGASTRSATPEQPPTPQPESETQLLTGPYNPYTSRINIHLHHWQIFYMLAFFTRFTHPVSQVAAGIVLACYMEGICAYGYDSLVNDG
ncbi:uncharacterized protein BYT42DRAFT_616812 [Radiomyces spectabilis]|uniref:uncharacterized protein n=1 Tax=Radiomyces spectabilis TaxID=64574 RepID=UPI0022200682|nr:uncharacterized protein BYT42DRAFT_616812 [Radiomyces spectabilis]KAI8371745.1 hypothetical protein BYT42DRAFT_616812 [Radiomyces spectabilis]